MPTMRNFSRNCNGSQGALACLISDEPVRDYFTWLHFMLHAMPDIPAIGRTDRPGCSVHRLQNADVYRLVIWR
jgi:hypothetical protein